ncbi:DNA polymerase I [compost metagenome]
MRTIEHSGHLESVFADVKIQQCPDEVDIMVIGDIPTAMELRKGKYLQGAAVDILKQTLVKVGLPVSDEKVHYTTAIKTAYPKKKGKGPVKEIILAHHKMIVREINEVKPQIVLVLGKTAIQTVYGDASIKVGSVMGRVTPVPGVGEEITVVPVLHPALIMRSPGEYKPFLAAMEFVATLFKGGSAYDTGETKWQVLDNEEKVEAALKLLATKKEVSADMETTGLDYRIVEFLVMGIGFEKNKVFVIPREMRHRVKDFFALPNLTWTWQHGKYDTKVMWRRKIATVPLHDDVMYMHYTLDETSAHDLEHLSKIFLQADAYKFKMNQNFKAITLENYPQWFDALCERVAVDCDYTYQLKHVILERLSEAPELKTLYERLIMPAASYLSRVEQNGILIYPPLLEEYGRNYVARLEDIMREVEELAAPHWDPELYMAETGAKSAGKKSKDGKWGPFNPGSPQMMSWMVFKRLKLKPRRKSGTSTNADVLESIEPQHPLVDKVLEYRSVKKEYSTYVLGLLKWRDDDGHVRTNFNLQVTATGRLSSKEPNMQNLPNAFGVGNIRRAVIPPKGYILMDSDYSGAELRWLACLSKCPVLLDTFSNGINIHNRTAKSIWGSDYTPQHKMRAKAVNFGIPYGREWPSFVDEFNISKEEAVAMIEGWLDTYYGARDYLQWCADAVVKGYYLSTPYGRRRRAGLVTPDSLHGLQNEFRNFPIQSASSDTTLVAGMELEEPGHKFGAQHINLVHDSILFYVPADPQTILDFGYLVNQHLINVPKRLFGYEVPFASDTDIGFTWGDLVGLNFEKETVTWEEFDPVTKKKTEKSRDFRDWFYEKQAENEYKYEEQWYKDLKSVDSKIWVPGA